MSRLKRLQQPFWIVTLFSGFVALVVLLSLLVFYEQYREWQYLVLGALASTVLLAHGLAWWLAHARGKLVTGIWLVATAQILSAVLVPLFLADYWFISFFQFAAVPLAVGIADQPRRIPLAAVLTLLGTAGMLTADLLVATQRLTILSDRPAIVVSAILLLIAQFIGLAVLLWYLRLRPRTDYRVRLDLATQLSLVLTAVSAASIIIVTGVLVVQIRTSRITQVGQNFKTLAEINAERVGNNLEQEIDGLLALGRQGTILQEGLATANDNYPASREEVLQLLEEREQRWQASPDTSEFVLTYRSNPQTIELSRFRGADLLHNDVFLTDRYGGLVAAQGARPAHLYFGKEAWWQAAWNDSRGGIYVGEPTIDPETGTTSIFMAVGVLNPKTNQTVGVLASTFDLKAVQQEIHRAQSQISGEIALVASDGRIIAGPDEALIGQPGRLRSLADAIATASPGDIATRGQPVLAKSGWILGTDRQGESAVLAYAPLNTTSGVKLDTLRALNWQVVASDTQANALAGVTRSMQVASLVGVLVMVLVVVSATAIARIIARPIESITITTTAISEGDLQRQVDPVGPVELVTLAEAFNSLTNRLRSLISNLQDQVAQRTAQLESRAEQLAMLNRITQEVASVHDLHSCLQIVAREMVQLFDVRNTGIALLNEERTELTVVADYSQVDRPSTVGVVIPVQGNPSSMQVIESGRSLAIAQIQTNPLTEPIHDLMRRQGTQCMMIVPLLARGEVIGTIGVTSDQADRAFTPAEVELTETIAGQLAGAIESARLFTEMEKAKEEAEAANAAKSAFLASVSHELRTPLTSVLGFAKLVRKRLEERVFPAVQTDDRRTRRAMEQASYNLEIIVSEGNRLTTLINNVLDLAKIEAGRVEWQMQQLTISEVIEQATAATAALFEEKENLALIADVEDDLPGIIGDRDRLIQVVINLIANAVKFTDQGSVTCQAERIKQEIVVRVIDTGVGITEADQLRVFEMFTQVGDTLTGKPRGTGLGLTICKEIVERHNGRIWVESEVGKGSTFAFALPLRGVETEADVKIPLEEGLPGGHGRLYA